MKIGIVGPPYSIERIQSLISMEDAYVECVEYPCNLKNVVEILSAAQKDLDGVFFTGIRYFDYACRYGSASVPWTYPKRSEIAIVYALLKARLACCDINRITFDLHTTTSEQLLDILCDKLGIDAERISLYRYNDTQEYQSFLNGNELAGKYAVGACKFHLKNFRHNLADICLTDSPAVATSLARRGKPAFLVTFSEEQIISALNDLRTRSQLNIQRRKDENQEAVVFLTVQMLEEYDYGNPEYRQIQTIGQIERAIFLFAQSVGAAVEKRSNTQYLIFTAKGALDAATDNMREISFANALLGIIDVKQFSVGIGYGMTHSIAKRNALQANKSARQQPYSCYYSKNGEDMVVGPVLVAPKQPRIEFADLVLERISRETNVGLAALKTLARVQRQYNFQTITSSELSEMTGMSLNSIHRIIVKLEAKGYVEIVGHESRTEAGRPRRLIRFHLGFMPSDKKG